ncbi:MAG: exo-alpha-sialidase, partial [Candidatus Omnitrophica bacterium]|nr:exo-alpha-sialidase [Candidatus Omnitrophota bacterium]
MSIRLSNTKIVGLAVCGIIASCWMASGVVWAADDSEAPQAGSLFMTDLFENVRLPGITVTQDGTLLAFAEGCRLLRRSEDRGKSW